MSKKGEEPSGKDAFLRLYEQTKESLPSEEDLPPSRLPYTNTRKKDAKEAENVERFYIELEKYLHSRRSQLDDIFTKVQRIHQQKMVFLDYLKRATFLPSHHGAKHVKFLLSLHCQETVHCCRNMLLQGLCDIDVAVAFVGNFLHLVFSFARNALGVQFNNEVYDSIHVIRCIINIDSYRQKHNMLAMAHKDHFPHGVANSLPIPLLRVVSFFDKPYVVWANTRFLRFSGWGLFEIAQNPCFILTMFIPDDPNRFLHLFVEILHGAACDIVASGVFITKTQEMIRCRLALGVEPPPPGSLPLVYNYMIYPPKSLA